MTLPAQGIMISERPSELSSTLAGARALDGAGSIGNYKGVMLCNRPFAGTTAAAKGGDVAAGLGKQVFVTGKVKSEVGFAGKNIQTDKLLRKRVKQETALTRHRRWLADLQRTKQALEDQYIEDLQKREESRKRFAEKEASMRQMARELGHQEGGHEQSSSAQCDGEEVKRSQPCAMGGERDRENRRKSKDRRESGEDPKDDGQTTTWDSRSEPSELRAAEKRRKRDGKPCRPMWAMTEAEASAENELRHEEELEVRCGSLYDMAGSCERAPDFEG